MSADPPQRATAAAVLASPYVRGWAIDAMASWLLAFATASAIAAVTTPEVVVLEGAGRAVVALVGMLYLLPLLRHRRGPVNRR